MLQEASGAVAFYDDREDVLVIDDPDVSPSSEVVVHVHNPEDGLWHKLTPNHHATSCGTKFNLSRVTFRREALEQAHAMCSTCFTDYERQLAADADAQRQRDTLEQVPLNLRDWLDDPSRPQPKRRK